MDTIVALVPESKNNLKVRYVTLPLLVNILAFIDKIRVTYNTGVYWVVFCLLECIAFSRILNNSLECLVYVRE